MRFMDGRRGSSACSHAPSHTQHIQQSYDALQYSVIQISLAMSGNICRVCTMHTGNSLHCNGVQHLCTCDNVLSLVLL